MASESKIDLADVRIAGSAECLGGFRPTPPLEGYPLLVLAPFQWGPGVREHSRGVTVEAIAGAYCAHPDADAVAGALGIEVDAVVQAVNYAAAVGFLAGS